MSDWNPFVKSRKPYDWQCEECGWMNEEDGEDLVSFYRIPKTDISLCYGCAIKKRIRDFYSTAEKIEMGKDREYFNKYVE